MAELSWRNLVEVLLADCPEWRSAPPVGRLARMASSDRYVEARDRWARGATGKVLKQLLRQAARDVLGRAD